MQQKRRREKMKKQSELALYIAHYSLALASIVLTLLALYLLASCGAPESPQETPPDPVQANSYADILSGSYPLWLHNTAESCDPDGRRSYQEPILSALESDGYGQLSIHLGRIAYSLAYEPIDAALTQARTIPDDQYASGGCQLYTTAMDAEVLDNRYCKSLQTVATVSADYHVADRALAGSIELTYAAGCGADAKSSGSRTLLFDGKRLDNPYICKRTSKWCYRLPHCKALLPGCRTPEDSCA
ncbi:MAG: hypothetical protein WCV82_03740, partial [Candidatus Paceibacterota bacterium]